MLILFFIWFCFLRIKMYEERKIKQKNNDEVLEGVVFAYLLDREGQSRVKVLLNMIKQKRKEKVVSLEWIRISQINMYNVILLIDFKSFVR